VAVAVGPVGPVVVVQQSAHMMIPLSRTATLRVRNHQMRRLSLRKAPAVPSVQL